MLDHLAAREAFRARLLTLVVATTGSTTLAATSAGFTRSAGSFVTDKFSPGMEVVADGFSDANEAPALISSVVPATPLVMGIAGGRTAQPSGGSRTLTVGLPAIRQWHGTQTPEEVVRGTRPSVIEQWVPSSVDDDGMIIDTGFYVVTLNLPGNKGLAASLRYMQAMRNLFPPGLQFTIDGDLVRVTGSPAPYFSQPTTLENGYESSTLTVPWRVATTNLAA